MARMIVQMSVKSRKYSGSIGSSSISSIGRSSHSLFTNRARRRGIKLASGGALRSRTSKLTMTHSFSGAVGLSRELETGAKKHIIPRAGGVKGQEPMADGMARHVIRRSDLASDN